MSEASVHLPSSTRHRSQAIRGESPLRSAPPARRNAVSGLATAIAACSWLNCIMLYVILRASGHFRIELWLWGRIARQFIAGAVMGGALWLVRIGLHDWFAGSVGERMVAVMALVAVGGIVYFAVAWVIGAMNRDDILILLRRKKVS